MPAPKIFVSYSHDSPEHAARVLALSDALRRDGIDATIDRYTPVPSEGWPTWMERNLEEADFVLLICTSRYLRRYRRQEVQGVGQGVQWESNLVANDLYENLAQGDRYLPILLDGAAAADIPKPFQGFTRFSLAQFDVAADEHYQALYRHLTGRPATPKSDLGSLIKLDPVPRLSVKSVSQQSRWNVPFQRNPVFTGREDTLALLAKTLKSGDAAAITQAAAISGMGGIGKTQTAVEFAYRHRDEYEYVLWMKSENETTLRESFIEVARLLGLPEANEQDQTLAIEATKHWLTTHENWLLILDNADDVPMAHAFLPKTSHGHILYTTRASTGGRHAKTVRIDRLSVEDGALLLLRRADIIAQDALLDVATSEDRDAALKLSKIVDGLPLALDQAGAFIQEQQTTVARYLEHYKTQEAVLLADYGDSKDRDHASVHVTFSLAFAQAEATNPAVGDLLRLCAFLAPDNITEFIFTRADSDNLGPHLGPIVSNELAWEKLLGEACGYSLLSRDATKKTVSIHRLVQVILRDKMTEDEQSNWVEHVIDAVVNVFPNPEFRNWPVCDQLLPHAQVCAEWRRTFEIDTVQAGLLIGRAGYYLKERAQYDQVEPLYLEVLEIYRHQLGSDHSETATSLNNLAALYDDQGRYVEAEPLYLEALEIDRRQLGSDHPSTAQNLNNLAELYRSQDRYVEAEPLYLEALEIWQKRLGRDHPTTAISLGNLAVFYRSQGRYVEAEPLYLPTRQLI